MSLFKVCCLLKFAQTKLSMIEEIALETYTRKEQFNFFKDFEEPFFGITTTVDLTRAYAYCKANALPIFAYYLHAANTAVNAIPNFKQRIHKGKIIAYDRIDVSTTIARPDHTFGFSMIKHAADFNLFKTNFSAEKERVLNTTQLMPDGMTDQVVHYSALPWFNFSAVSHARKFSINDSCPKITFGKIQQEAGQVTLPVSVHAHHALVDGYHVGLLMEAMQNALDRQ